MWKSSLCVPSTTYSFFRILLAAVVLERSSLGAQAVQPSNSGHKQAGGAEPRRGRGRKQGHHHSAGAGGAPRRSRGRPEKQQARKQPPEPPPAPPTTSKNKNTVVPSGEVFLRRYCWSLTKNSQQARRSNATSDRRRLQQRRLSKRYTHYMG